MFVIKFIPLIACITGIGTILLTRLVSFLTMPQLFENSIPTISKTAAFEPANTVFLIGMTVVSIISQIVWIRMFLSYKVYFPLLTSYRTGIISLFTGASISGIVAGICLGTLAHISLEDSDPGHIALSYGFFIFQILAFFFDAMAFDMVKKQLRVNNVYLCNIDFFFRRLIAYSLPVLGGIFYFLYIAKDTDWFEDPMFIQTFYVSLEYVIGITCFLYCATLQRYLQTQHLSN